MHTNLIGIPIATKNIQLLHTNLVGVVVVVVAIIFFFFLFFPFYRHNGPASAAPCQEGHFWKRSETKKRILRVAQKTQIRAALQELLESLPDRMWKETMRSKCAKTDDSENPVSEYVCL